MAAEAGAARIAVEPRLTEKDSAAKSTFEDAGAEGQVQKSEVTAPNPGESGCLQVVTSAHGSETEASAEEELEGAQVEKIRVEVDGRLARTKAEGGASSAGQVAAALHRESQRLESGADSRVVDGEVIRETRELHNGEGETTGKYLEGKRQTRSVQWRGDTTDRPAHKDGNTWRQQAWETAPASLQPHTNPLPLGKWNGPYPTSDIEHIVSTFPETEAPYSITNRPPEVIRVTQSLPKIKKGSMYRDIMASIGLDSPNTSTENMRDETSGDEQGASLANTPIRTSASSLIALGQHVLTPRQGRLWNMESNPERERR